MTDHEKEKRPRRSWGTAAHMLGFGLLLALIILLAKGPPVDSDEGGRVSFTEAEMPSDAMWQELAALLGSHPAKWMIWEGEPSSDITAKLSELGVRSVVLDPCAGTPDSGDFASVMKLNMAALKTVFGQP